MNSYSCGEKSGPTKTRLCHLLEQGKFVVTGEVAPPHGANPARFVEKVQLIRNHCDAINITDNVRGIPSMSSMVCAHLVLDNNAEPIMQMSARDRNRVAVESELYGAYALGVRNALFVTGDHTLLGSHPHTKMVYDLDSIQTLSLASHLMKGTDLAGDELEGSPKFFLGATFNPYADPIKFQAMRTQKKVEAGARFFQTQAIYDIDRLQEFMELVPDLGAYVLAGIIPLKGPKMAWFMNTRIPGIKIPQEMMERLENAGDSLKGKERIEATRAEGLRISLETIEAVKNIKDVDGIHIMGVGWEECIPLLVEDSKSYPRPGV